MLTRCEHSRQRMTARQTSMLRPGRLVTLAALAVTLATGRAGATPFAYVGSTVGGSSSVKVIDTATDTVVATIPVDVAVGGIVLSPDGSRVYVTPYSIKVIDTATNSIVATIPNFGTTFSPVLTSDGTRLYVLNYPGGSDDILQVIDTATNTTLNTASITGNIAQMIINPAGTRLYMLHGNQDWISVIDTSTLTQVDGFTPVPFTTMLRGAFTPDGAKLYAGGNSGQPLLVIDAATDAVLTTVPIPYGAGGLAMNPAGTRLYAPSTGTTTLNVIDVTNDTLLTTVNVGCAGGAVAVNPAGTRAYFHEAGGCDVEKVLDTATNTIVDSIPIGGPSGDGFYIGPFCPGSCSDGNPCTTDSCNSIAGCSYTNNNGPCASDGNQCTDDVCDGAGNCTHPSSLSGSSCSDGLFCDGTDTCDGSGGCNNHTGDPCAGGPECAQTCNEAAQNCFDLATTSCSSDGEVCTDDHCNGAGACIHTANTASCDDGLFCDGTDTCAGGTCHHSGDPCTGGGECANLCNEAADNCFEMPGTPCTADAIVCTLDQCDGAGACAHPPGNPGTVCRSAAGPCDVAETCTGTSATCPADGFKADGTSCSDNNACTSGESCTGGVCGGGSTVACPLCQTCDTVDGCVVGPRAGCKHPLAPKKAGVSFQDLTADTAQVKWKWNYGQATTFAELGGPLTADDHALCVYDGSSNLVVSFQAPAGGMCGTKPCWKQIGPSTAPSGYKYKDATRQQNGLDTLILKSGVDTKAKMIFKAKGPNIPMPSLSFALPLTVQLQDEEGSCWESAFPSSGVTVSTPTYFRAKGQ